MALSKSQYRQLRTLAHKLKPVVWIGQNGLTDNVLGEIEAALLYHELIKVKLRTGDRDEHNNIIESICDRTGAERVQGIGNVVTLYRQNPDTPVIRLV
ncbi:MAG TPA: ribosome assembly RNA-binding protein YhbY [Gammaproteobacteria bacterium]|nr:ribosome assembly RNA-binding protein YhbY [Gammaproteobacteria bacterium]